jgi:DNA polymerase-3 subunit delta
MPRLIVIEGHESQRRKLEELLAEFSKKGYVLTGKFEAASVEGGWPEVIAASRNRSLFDDKRMTIVEGAELLGAFPPALSGYLDGDGADDVVVAVFGGDAKKIFAKESLEKIAFIRPAPSVSPWGRRDWLIGLARAHGANARGANAQGANAHGAKLDSAAAALLAESLESQEELRAELDKLILYANGGTITVDTVRNLSFDEGGNALLRFLDGVCQARQGDVLSALRRLRSESSPLPLLSALYNRLRPALYIACTPPRAQAKALAAIGANREYALRMARSALDRFGGENIKSFMLSLIRLSYLEKTSAGEGWIGFETALWRLMGTERGGR